MPEITHRIHRIVQLRAAEVLAGLRQRRHKMRMIRARERHHRKPVRKRSQVLFQFVGGPARRYEMNFVEIKTPVRRSCHRQMSRMNGIKRSAKQRNPSRLDFCRCTLRLRCRQCASPMVSPNSLMNPRLAGALQSSSSDSSRISARSGCSASSIPSEPFSVSSSTCSFGIFSSASAIPRTNSFTPSPVAAEMA